MKTAHDFGTAVEELKRLRDISDMLERLREEVRKLLEYAYPSLPGTVNHDVTAVRIRNMVEDEMSDALNIRRQRVARVLDAELTT